MLNEKQKRFIELDKKKQEFKLLMEEYSELTEQLANEMGVGGHFQDEEGTVYKVEECKGKFVHFDKYDVKRTRREGERSGSLSLTKARDMGYDV